MTPALLAHIACPWCWGALELTTFAQRHGATETGYLVCSDCRRIYPVIDCVPRLVPDAVVDYYGFFAEHRARIPAEVWEHNLTPANLERARQSLRKQKRTQASFSKEWSFQVDTEKTWGFEPRERLEHVIRRSLEMTPDACRGKTILDAGCGNGILTSLLGEHFETVIGVDLGTSVVQAALRNSRSNVHFVQGDLMHPPFRGSCADVLISLGVLHHTPNTELAFSCLAPLVTSGGRMYVWLYKPEPDFHHQAMLALREVFKHLPPSVSAVVFKTAFVPAALLKRRIKNAVQPGKEKEQSTHEQLIHFMDGLTCQYRFEHTPEEVGVWFHKRGFTNIKVPVSYYLGFGIYGDKTR
jgi:2-polyprenyl-3-methyl-5-hydroxy-6-metoxy-1,4-benzoquinol methylase/uncharacterized protein YbaR (Trm112 family)